MQLHTTKFVACLVGILSCAANLLAAEADDLFAKRVGPLFAAKCISCHGQNEQKGGLDLSTAKASFAGGESGEVIVAGKPEASRLLELILPGKDGAAPEMPKKGTPFTAAEAADIRAWIAAGAKWPQGLVLQEASRADKSFWSLQPLKPSVPPAVAGAPAEWNDSPIDRHLLAAMKTKGLAPNPPAERRALYRRLSYDLHGLPPAPEDLEAFASDPSPRAYEELVDRLLASPRFGERWARHWLDVVRFAESDGFETNQPRPNAWVYRDYVIRSFNDDKPYDQFVREQLAGDQLGAEEATGFLVGGPYDRVKSPDPVLTAQQRADEMHDMVSTTGSAFLGLTVGCARCHNHKFDPILQSDYYAIKACLAGVQHGERPLNLAGASARGKRIAAIRAELEPIEAKLRQYQPRAAVARSILIDDVASAREMAAAKFTVLQMPTGKAPNAAGTNRGELDDAGDVSRLPNLGQAYTWWQSSKGKDLCTWNPQVAGKYKIWVSWGCGWYTHAQDARYVLDRDGDLTTRDDQQEIAKIDQRKFADGTGDLPSKPLWSGFRLLGTFDLTAASRILLRGGEQDVPATADAILLEEIPANSPALEIALAGEPVISPHLRSPSTARENVERFDPVDAKFLRFTIQATNSAEPCIDELEVFAAAESRNVALTSAGAKATSSGNYPGSPIHKLEHLNDGRYGNEWSWISNEAGRGWVTIEFAKAEKIDRITWSRDRSNPPRYDDRAATQYMVEVSLDGSQWKPVASSGDRLPRDYPLKSGSIPTVAGLSPIEGNEIKVLTAKRQALSAELQALSISRMAYAGRFTSPEQTFLLHRGDPTQPRQPIAPGALTQIAAKLDIPAGASDSDRRLALAKWIVSAENPLAARVIANRLWHHHFGRGLVDTPSDLGYGGGRPSHPELLDWLAGELTSHGWSLKHLHRTIVFSAAYRQSSAAREEAQAIDASAVYLWRYPPRRLEAEPLRDAILATTGQLDLTMSGPGFDLFEPNGNYVKVYNSKKQFGPDTFRRMVYQSKPRMQLDDTFGAFDCPDAGQVAPKRHSSTTPLQALSLLNSPFLLDQAENFALRVKREAGEDAQAQTRRAFSLAFGRSATADEIAGGTALVSEHGLAALCRALLNSNEFVMIP